MQTKPKANSVVTSRWDADTSSIVFAVVGVGETVLRLSAISEAVRTRATIHGLTQRVSDRAAKNRDTATGLPATPASKLAAMATLVDHYMTGTEAWGMAAAPIGPRPLDPIIILAIMEATGKEEDYVRAYVGKKADETKTTPHAYLAHLATGKTVAPIVDRLRAESVTGDAEDGLLGMMED